MPAPLTTTLTVLVCIDGCGWIIGVIPTLYYAFTHRALPRLGGIRLLSGPFETLGMDALIVAGLVFVVVSALKFMAAYWLWNARLDGAILELILLARFRATLWTTYRNCIDYFAGARLEHFALSHTLVQWRNCMMRETSIGIAPIFLSQCVRKALR